MLMRYTSTSLMVHLNIYEPGRNGEPCVFTLQSVHKFGLALKGSSANTVQNFRR